LARTETCGIGQVSDRKRNAISFAGHRRARVGCEAAVNFIQAAKEAGVTVAINLSQRSANRDSTSYACRDSFITEQVFDWSGRSVIRRRATRCACNWRARSTSGSRRATLGRRVSHERHGPGRGAKRLEDLPLGRADMMTFDLIPVGSLWPLGLLLLEPAK
jgi:hypothetical protein